MKDLTGTASTRIAAEIRSEIGSGQLVVGDRVPSTREIMRRWGVAMATASKVLATLRDEGLVHTRPGAGTVVAGGNSPRARASGRPRGSDATLSKERILAAALAVADKEGLEALSMRRVATELDVATMSLYRHVRDKNDLLDLMMDTSFAEWRLPPAQPGDNWQEVLASAAREMWRILRRHLWIAPAYSMTRPSVLPSGLAYTEHVLGTLLDRGLQPGTAFSMHLILFNYVRGFATSLAMEAAAEADTGVTADEWMDLRKSALETVVASQRSRALRTVLASFEPEGYDMDLDELFETGLQYLLNGFGAAFRPI